MSKMDRPVVPLPLPLLLLIHLHLLEYPKVNAPEYDINLFNPRVRGLRDRITTMQDICYFLVNKIERGNGIKKLLPSYPCSKPADTATYRNSLTKYLEQLRHHALSVAETDETTPATWWKDVPVRKSILEQCEGDRLERLLLSLSTHALFSRCHRQKPRIPYTSPSTLYASRVSETKAQRNAWILMCTQLQQRRQDLQTIRDILPTEKSQYDSVPTDRLLSLVESKAADLKHSWSDRALDFLIDLAGFRPHSILDTCETESQQELLTTISNQSLPIAAAHHASTLRRLKKPLSKTPSTNQLTLAHPKAHSLLDAEKQTRNLLNKALATMRKNPAPPVKGKGSQGSFSLRPTVCFNLKVDFEAGSWPSTI